MKFDKVTLVQVVESLRILQAVCHSNEDCTTCCFYDPEERETACMLCKSDDNPLEDHIAAMLRVGGLQVKHDNNAERSEKKEV